MAYKIPYAVWTGIGLVAGALFVVLGQSLAYFMNERVMVSLDVLLFGYVVIHTFISVVKEVSETEQGNVRAVGSHDASDDLFQK